MANKACYFLLLNAILINGASIKQGIDFEVLDVLESLLETQTHSDYWESQADDFIEKKFTVPKYPQKNVAKNVIIFVGDGMGTTTATAGRIYKGQRSKGYIGEEYSLSFEKFPHVALAKTYNVDKQVPDSAGTATAIFTGVKSRFKMVGLDGRNQLGEYQEDEYNSGKLSSIMSWAQSANKRTGFVTTTRVTHATPAATYAHSLHRDWECDSLIPEKYRHRVKDIAKQLVHDEPGRYLNVILGGGQEQFGFKAQIQGGPSACARHDKLNLTDEWLSSHPHNTSYFVVDSDGLYNVPEDAQYLLGLFSWGHMPYELIRRSEHEKVPSLTTMMEKAINILRHSDDGFVLMVEGGLIDVAHHDNMARLSLEEVSEFDNAVKRAVELSDPDTLIVVTSDHSHSFTFNGYAPRGNDIMGFGNETLPYLTLSYANGPGFNYHYNPEGTATSGFPWRNLSVDDSRLKNPFYQHLSSFYMKDDTHGGEDVPVYALGPMSNIFSGVIEQSYIPHLISYAMCMGPQGYKNPNCNDARSPRRAWNKSSRFESNFVLVMILVYLITRLR